MALEPEKQVHELFKRWVEENNIRCRRDVHEMGSCLEDLVTRACDIVGFLPLPPPEPEGPTLGAYRVDICSACVEGIGEECHTPGCLMYLRDVDGGFGKEFMNTMKVERRTMTK